MRDQLQTRKYHFFWLQDRINYFRVFLGQTFLQFVNNNGVFNTICNMPGASPAPVKVTHTLPLLTPNKKKDYWRAPLAGGRGLVHETGCIFCELATNVAGSPTDLKVDRVGQGT